MYLILNDQEPQLMGVWISESQTKKMISMTFFLQKASILALNVFALSTFID